MKTNIESIAMALLDEQSSQWVLVWNRQGYKNITRLQHTIWSSVWRAFSTSHGMEERWWQQWFRDEWPITEINHNNDWVCRNHVDYCLITLIIKTIHRWSMHHSQSGTFHALLNIAFDPIRTYLHEQWEITIGPDPDRHSNKRWRKLS